MGLLLACSHTFCACGRFYEFLTSITDAPILVRNGATYETSSFVDAQTTSITVAMVAFAPEYGLASTISITATMSADVEVDFALKHFQSLEGDELNEYRAVSIFGFVLAAIILVNKIYAITTRGQGWHEYLPGFVLDILVQVVLPVVYFSIRLMQVSASKDAISGKWPLKTSLSFLVTHVSCMFMPMYVCVSASYIHR